jgi:hypothetical protein
LRYGGVVAEAATPEALEAEVDLLSRRDRIAIEIDGYHHFADLDAYRRDGGVSSAGLSDGAAAMTTTDADRLDTLVLARLATSARPPRPSDLVKALRRFSPRDLTEAQWRDAITGALGGLQARELVDASRRARPDELARRIGRHAARTWKQLADRVLPGLALGIDAGDAKAHDRLAGGKPACDAWAAAIAARALGVWRAGPPPSPGALCDALVWQELGLAGAPQRCPPELRAHFLRRRTGGDAAPPERLLRMFAARTVDAPRVELAALRDGLVRQWLAGRERGAHVEAEAPRSLIADVRAVADAAREGVFGDRKVFISAVWDALRAMPAWASLELDELKGRLLAAHRSRELVLARADLVAAMDPARVATSETRTDGATFHFVVREPRS